MKIRHWLALTIIAFSGAGCATPGTPTTVHYLSGHGKDDPVMWDFYCTDGRNNGSWTKIKVPSNWETEGFGTYMYGTEFRTPRAGGGQPPSEQGLYRFDFDVPADWKGKVVRLVFDGVMTDADVKINGQSAGLVHQGSFYEFKYDITPLLKFGETNRLEVTVSKESANRSVNNAERRGDYWTFGGIFRPVFLEVTPPSYIDWTALDARADGAFRVDVHLDPASEPRTVTAQILDMQGRAVGQPFSAAVPAGQNVVTLSSKLDGVKTWTAETPNLYYARFTLSQDGKAGHVITQRFGFRTFEVRPGDGLYLNRQKIVLKGVDRHSFWPETGRTLSKEICYEDVRLIKEMNMNAVRMSHYPPDRDFLEACDELGLYVLDELAGWHGSYDTPTGQKLIGEMVRRDVNHPSILFWDNGNEGGWNNANNGEFAKWDPQQRTVLHPWELFGNVQTKHYPTYAEMTQLAAAPDIFMPTEFNHGLYDGGGGSALRDFWNVMSANPRAGGGFIWAFLDEGVVRTDENGRIDALPNQAPDGLLGPHREKEGSFYAVKQIWSPIEISGPAVMSANFNGEFKVKNSYDFTNFSACKVDWSLLQISDPDGKAQEKVIASGSVHGGNIAPHAQGMLDLPLPKDFSSASVLQVTARNPLGRILWTWSWLLPGGRNPVPAAKETGTVTVRRNGGRVLILGEKFVYAFDPQTGLLTGIEHDGRKISFDNGPRFVAYERDFPTGRPNGPQPTTTFRNIAGSITLAGFNYSTEGGDAVLVAKYNGALKQVTWRVHPSGQLALEYTYVFDGQPDILGVAFDFPEDKVEGMAWFGWGPYHTWRNRADGAILDLWHNRYTNPQPGVRWDYPEFKGYFRGWRWADLETTEGKISMSNRATAENSFLGIYTPLDGPVGPLLDLPKTGIAFLDVIPPMRDKFKIYEQLGPGAAPQAVSGEHTGSIVFDFFAE